VSALWQQIADLASQPCEAGVEALLTLIDENEPAPDTVLMTIGPTDLQQLAGIIRAEAAVSVETLPDGRSELVLALEDLRLPRQTGRERTAIYVAEQAARAAAIVGRPAPCTPGQVERHLMIYPALPFRAMIELNAGELARLTEEMPGITGMEVSTDMRRIYPDGEPGAHVIGYVDRRREPSAEERADFNYYLPELRGRRGLETVFDSVCAGVGGARMVRVDSTGYYHEDVIPPVPPRAGHDLQLTIDSRAQEIAQRLMQGKRGALVLLNCRNGAVIAMVSAPSFDLNQVRSRYRQLSAAEDRPLVNRALAAGYAPGSIIKPLVALAALQHRQITPETVYRCEGYHRVGNSRVRCSVRSGHGDVQLASAIEQSCNPYFIAAGVATGIDRLQPLFRDAGLGRGPGLELQPRGSAGILPGRGELIRRQHRSWTAFDTALVSIGQGFIAISPLQAAAFTAALANGGTLYRPHLVRGFCDANGRYLRVTKPRILSTLNVAPEYFALVHAGMRRVVVGASATAPAAQTPVIELAGKTGTAQAGRGRTNTWFVCFGPYKDPTYAMAVLVEDGQSGGRSAAPVARRFFEQYIAATAGDQLSAR
jgi:penicillin-binding protein 2